MSPELQGTKPQEMTSCKGIAAEEARILKHLETGQQCQTVLLRVNINPVLEQDELRIHVLSLVFWRE